MRSGPKVKKFQKSTIFISCHRGGNIGNVKVTGQTPVADVAGKCET